MHVSLIGFMPRWAVQKHTSIAFPGLSMELGQAVTQSVLHTAAILPRYRQCPEGDDMAMHVHVTRGYLGRVSFVPARLEKSQFVVLTVTDRTVGGLPGEGGVWGEDEMSGYTRFIPTTGCQLPHRTLSREVVLSLSRDTQTPLEHFTYVFLFTCSLLTTDEPLKASLRVHVNVQEHPYHKACRQAWRKRLLAVSSPKAKGGIRNKGFSVNFLVC